MSDYLRSSADIEADKEASRLITQKIHCKFSDVFTRIGWFNGLFKLRVKEGSCSYQSPCRRVAYALQQSLKDELNRLQKQPILVPLDVDETSEYSNSFILVPKVNVKV